MYGWNYNVRFKLQADYSADPVVLKPVPGVWLDTKFDANRDGNGGNAQGVDVETTNDNNQLVQGCATRCAVRKCDRCKGRRERKRGRDALCAEQYNAQD